MQQEKKAIKTISVMLDVSGTSTCIDDQSAQIFINQLEEIRKHFGADIGTISISTSSKNLESIQYILYTLAKNLTGNIVIGLSFLAGATYDYEKKILDIKNYNFNADKVATFDEYYISNPEYDNQWFALIDDNLYDDVYRQYRDTHPMFVCRPTKRENEARFMTYDTETRDFDGVTEGLAYYIGTIKDMTREKILNHQRFVLSYTDLEERFKKGDLDFIKRYLLEGPARVEDCNAILELFRRKRNFGIGTLTNIELKKVRTILCLIDVLYKENNNEIGSKYVKSIRDWQEFRIKTNVGMNSVLSAG